MTVYEFAKGLILEAGINVKKIMKQDIKIETKSNPNDLVTNVDKATEKYLFDNIKQTYPNHLVIGEEGHGHELKDEAGVVWVIDPIDGTLNFVHQQENFAISIGIYNDGKPHAGFVYDVMNDVLYHAKTGEGAYENGNLLPAISSTQLKTSIIGINPNWLTKPRLGEMFKPIVNEARSARAYGSAALEIIHVATGKLGAYMTPRLQPWDFAGGLIILNEVGGVGTNLLGEPLSIYEPSSIIMANKDLHSELIDNHFKKNYEIVQLLQQKLKAKND
ncbi:inositol monophosphatase family protein [Staphylococcus saprophyticus]|uniref:inositol monophosphatase family protein n=1 Tax=Staphylococcus saprophyticus TaxID=29385 RepID=UPI00157D2CC4|nr:inositol monophosphatase family protein [Staphylococcus saprophyticus]MDW3935418.1 inositol monophosphatase family protein [Staphylococcus saprophyticus]MDW4255684.1 inositol monophosphatase family protein [Staphylococcus saprophyticus]MDW4307209.1 inositol monophosphatase family protein [Staphylococcus saprophyticus]MDW4317289.1 inositol monophosphatase family protein [Staphylococcus saprophyticus]MDW4382067.1 inositol monophosphatase family protein [Staphylococcus saprophyticus]